MAKRFQLNDPRRDTHCQACGEVITTDQDSCYHVAGRYHADKCYDTLFADCLGCGRHCMDAKSNLSPTNHMDPKHAEQLCDDCLNKKHNWVVVQLIIN